MRTYLKDPDAILDYGIDWSNWLESGETIDTVTWTVPSGITDDSAHVNDGSTATIWLSGGTAGESYTIGCRITTSSQFARTDERSFVVKVVER